MDVVVAVVCEVVELDENPLVEVVVTSGVVNQRVMTIPNAIPPNNDPTTKPRTRGKIVLTRHKLIRKRTMPLSTFRCWASSLADELAAITVLSKHSLVPSSLHQRLTSDSLGLGRSKRFSAYSLHVGGFFLFAMIDLLNCSMPVILHLIFERTVLVCHSDMVGQDRFSIR